MDTKVSGKAALIVGAYGGMGQATCRELAREGVSIALVGRDPERLSALATECVELGAPAAIPISCDISRTATIAQTVQAAVDKIGGLNFLINFAGTYAITKSQDANLEEWDRMLDVNLRAHYHLVFHALPHINKQPGGAVIKIGSIANSHSGAALYSATNHGIDGFSDGLFEDVREYGTRVCTIRPGYVASPMVESSDKLDRKLMIQTEDIARTVLFVLTTPSTSCPTEITIRPQRSPYR